MTVKSGGAELQNTTNSMLMKGLSLSTSTGFPQKEAQANKRYSVVLSKDDRVSRRYSLALLGRRDSGLNIANITLGGSTSVRGAQTMSHRHIRDHVIPF